MSKPVPAPLKQSLDHWKAVAQKSGETLTKIKVVINERYKEYLLYNTSLVETTVTESDTCTNICLLFIYCFSIKMVVCCKELACLTCEKCVLCKRILFLCG